MSGDTNEKGADVISPRRLWLAITAAIAVAALLLVTVVLPMEYGIDPTSVGSMLGLQQERDAATGSPAGQEASAGAPVAQEQSAADELDAIMQGNTIDAAPGAHSKYSRPFSSEEVVIELKPFQEVEYKAHMTPDRVLLYSWESDKPVYADTHGEPSDYPDSPAVRYLEEDGVATAHGRISPPIAGIHGWYWLNTNETPITIRLKVSGWYENLEEEYRSEE